MLSCPITWRTFSGFPGRMKNLFHFWRLFRCSCLPITRQSCADAKSISRGTSRKALPWNNETRLRTRVKMPLRGLIRAFLGQAFSERTHDNRRRDGAGDCHVFGAKYPKRCSARCVLSFTTSGRKGFTIKSTAPKRKAWINFSLSP